MKYIKLFNKIFDFKSVKDSLDRPNVSLIQENNQVEYLAVLGIDYSKEYFTIEAIEDGLTAKLSINACEYCVDNGDWTTLQADTNTVSINAGQTLSFRGNLTPTSSNGVGTFTISKQCNIKGNIMSLLYGDDFEGQTDLTGKNYAFYKLFYECTNIIDAYNLILPAMILADRCYRNMFYGCTGLTTAPELPATTLANNCYYYMFLGCKNLTTAPELPATTLANNCYYGMFNGCAGLTTAPELPATTLAGGCYYRMFLDCTGLTTAPKLPATTLVEDEDGEIGCYEYMFFGCTGLTAAPELPATNLANRCYGSMFYGCTGLTAAPELPATTLTNNCYSYMFYGCTGFTVAPELPATTLTNNCYIEMFYGCSKLNYIKMLATDISAYKCLNNWVNGVSSTGTFVKHVDADIPTGNSGIPSGWTVETA